jgi:hypothetical protein
MLKEELHRSSTAPRNGIRGRGPANGPEHLQARAPHLRVHKDLAAAGRTLTALEAEVGRFEEELARWAGEEFA